MIQTIISIEEYYGKEILIWNVEESATNLTS
jgi:hypothetical protein